MGEKPKLPLDEEGPLNCPECSQPLFEPRQDGRFYCPGGCWPVGIELYQIQELEEEKAEMWDERGWPA